MEREVASTARLAGDTERARIDSIRASLRTSARWQAMIAFGIPGILSCAVLVTTLISYSGIWYEVLLVSIVQVVAVAAIFVVPTLFLGGYSVFTFERRLRRDAVASWPIERVRGNVTWSRRRRALVAKADGRVLASPFFTELNALPIYWDHFDQLAPGAYELELLRESGLVLNAKPCLEHAASDFDDQPGNVALRAAFRSSRDDLIANRRGRASMAQRVRLLVANAWLPPALGLLGVAATLTVREATGKPQFAVVLSALVATALAALMACVAGSVILDVVRGTLDSRAGLVHVQLESDDTDARCTVGGMDFTSNASRARILQVGTSYRVYVFRHSRQLAAAELDHPPEYSRGSRSADLAG